MFQVLFNYDWLHAKLSATSIHDVLQDFDAAIKAGVSGLELGLVASALRVGCPNIGFGCSANSLAFDLLGRLLVYYDYQPVIVLLPITLYFCIIFWEIGRNVIFDYQFRIVAFDRRLIFFLTSFCFRLRHTSEC